MLIEVSTATVSSLQVAHDTSLLLPCGFWTAH